MYGKNFNEEFERAVYYTRCLMSGENNAAPALERTKQRWRDLHPLKYIDFGVVRLRLMVHAGTVSAFELLAGIKADEWEKVFIVDNRPDESRTARDFFSIWLYCAVRSGEELDAREFPMSLDDFKKLMKTQNIFKHWPAFAELYAGPKKEQNEKI